MSQAPGSRRRGRWLAAGLGLLILVGVLAIYDARRAPTDTDARIEFYKTRLGGAGTYPAYARLGLAYLRKARETGQPRFFDEAERHLLESQRLQPNYEALRGLTDVCLARHQFHEALRYAEQAAATVPGDLEAQAARFDALLALGETQKADAALDRMLQQQVGFVSLSRLAFRRELQGNSSGALTAMARACAEGEKLALTQEARAWCQVRIGALYIGACDSVQAEHAFERALLILPDYFLAREHLAELRAAQGRQAEAAEIYEKLLESHPLPHYRLALADLYDAAARHEQASRLRSEAFGELLKSASGTSRADWRPLALVLLGDAATAAQGLEWAKRDWENRRDSFAADTLAWAYYRNGHIKEAAELLAQAVPPDSNQPAALLHAAEIQIALRQPEKARPLVERVLACPLRLSLAEKTQASRLATELKVSSLR